MTASSRGRSTGRSLLALYPRWWRDRYGDEIGKTFKTDDGAKPTYTLTGEELYVRAVITSSKPPQNPSA